MSRNQHLRRLIAREAILIAPGVYDAYLAAALGRAFLKCPQFVRVASPLGIRSGEKHTSVTSS